MNVVCGSFYNSCIMLPCICLYCALFWLVITFQIPCQYLYFDVCIWLTVGSKCKKGDYAKHWGMGHVQFEGHTFFARFSQITNPCPNPRQLWRSCWVGGAVLVHFFARALEIVWAPTTSEAQIFAQNAWILPKICQITCIYYTLSYFFFGGGGTVPLPPPPPPPLVSYAYDAKFDIDMELLGLLKCYWNKVLRYLSK